MVCDIIITIGLISLTIWDEARRGVLELRSLTRRREEKRRDTPTDVTSLTAASGKRHQGVVFGRHTYY